MYLVANPFEPVKNVATLSVYVRTWLLTFHNAVRTRNGQPIDITTLEQLDELYKTDTIQKCQINTLVANVNYGIRNGILKAEPWKRWFTLLNRLKVMSMA
jgi:short-subunit dehydrogenase